MSKVLDYFGDNLQSQIAILWHCTVLFPGELVGRSSHGISSSHLRGLGAGDSPAFPTYLSNRLFGDALLSEACWQSVIHWKTSGKSSLRKADARFDKSIAFSVRGSSLRVRLEWLPLENNNRFAKKKRKHTTIGIIHLLWTLRSTLVPIILIRKPSEVHF